MVVVEDVGAVEVALGECYNVRLDNDGQGNVMDTK